LTTAVGCCRMYLERNNMDMEKTLYEVSQLKRIADALEEILRLVKKDQEESKKRWEESE